MPRYKAEGDKDSDICIIGEAPARNEIREGRPFAGPAGDILNECLHDAQIIRRDCYITNVFDFEVFKKRGDPSGALFKEASCKTLLFSGTKFSEEGEKSVKRLHEELRTVTSNVIVPMGNPALAAIMGSDTIKKAGGRKRGITTWRGSILHSPLLKRKVIPTIHPAATLPNRGPFIWRYFIKHDFARKIKRESAFPHIKPIPYSFTQAPFNETMAFLRKCKEEKKTVAFDIEVKNQQISMICYATSHFHVMNIPFDDRWTDHEELEIWRAIAEIHGDEQIEMVAQNAIFDTYFMILTMGIYTKGMIKDTMIAHSIMYPEFPKSLAFLNSLYTDQAFHKDMVQHGDIEKEDG